MNFRQAKKKARLLKICGAAIGLPALVVTFISVLKLFYYSLDDGTALGGMVAQPLQRLVEFIYHQPLFPKWLWEYCPTPNPYALSDPNNLKFLVVYITIFIGAAVVSSGNALSRRLTRISQEIEDELLRQSLRGQSERRSREEMESTAEISSSSVFSQVHQLYLAPIITAVIGALLLKFLFGI
ncbi:YniB family protein [Stutzerimonas xanthomarina]|uniref:YniB family protein n=1 Tax=Stutzerimonas xanthomarina TaxID=271420 RepID=UPI003AA87761